MNSIVKIKTPSHPVVNPPGQNPESTQTLNPQSLSIPLD